jgi:hypothetical protein
MFHQALDLTGDKLLATYHPRARAMTPSGKWPPKITTVHNQYQHGLGQGTKPQQHSNQWSLIPHMHVPPQECTPSLSHSPSVATPPFPWSSTTSRIRKSQSTVAPGVPTSLRVSNQHLPELLLWSQHSNFNQYHLICITHMQLS